jgi:hypothetical protein
MRVHLKTMGVAISEDKESSDNSTKEDLEDISNQSKDIMEAYGIVGYHGACIFHVDGLHIETCRLIVIVVHHWGILAY